MLRALRGKTIIILEHRFLLTSVCRQRLEAAGSTVVGPVQSIRRVLEALTEGNVDAAIVDIEVDDQTLLFAASILENANVPFVFASRTNSHHGGYSMSGDSVELREIADALFGPPGTLATLH
ncbi:hypothetical protein [Agrobacterium sp. InxBP2]|uniref:hypothetical protein n=1 Tax=Agrobacterium sp. InxBP2 TaxID=2870329 RepID=UPI00249F7147|nr:hypothetical protein [Agrobacterium sp. InxBP2]